MRLVGTLGRTVIAFAAAVVATYLLAAVFYTQQVIAKQSAFAVYTTAQQIDTFVQNLAGLWLYGAMIAVALALAFAIAAVLKRILKPLAPVAYPMAGAAAMAVMITLIEQMLGGGAGVIGGARDAVGLSLQCLAGFFGGLVFAVLRPSRD